MTTTTNEIIIGQMKFKAEPRDHYLLFTLEGPFHIRPVVEIAARTMEFCQIYQASKVLFDFRAVTGNLSTLDRFTLASVFAGKYVIARLAGKISNCRFAAVGTQNNVDPNRFGETVAVNRGFPVKVFTDIDQALAWLTRLV